MVEQTANIELPKWKQQSLKVVSILLGVVFLIAGAPKVIALEGLREEFANWQYPTWFLIFTGLVEIVAAVLVVIQRTRYYGAMIIVCVMAGAIITLLKNDEHSKLVVPVAFLIMANFVLWVIRQQRGKKKSSLV